MAEIIMPPDPGWHNVKVDETLKRLNGDGSWKRQRIVYIVPMDAMLPGRVYLSHRSLIFPPNQAMYPIGIQGAEVGHAYSEALKMILDHPEFSQWEYVLTIEADNTPQYDAVLKLLAHMEAHPEFDCIGGLYFTKGFGGSPQIWGDITDPVMNFRPVPPRPDGGIVECYGTGMGFNLWRISMFKELRRKGVPEPWFKTVRGSEGVGTQDLYFWGQVAKPHGFRCAVACDVKVGHYDVKTGINW